MKTGLITMAAVITLLSLFKLPSAGADGQDCIVTRALYTGSISGESVDITLTVHVSLFDDRWTAIILPSGNYRINMERTTQNDREFLVNDGTCTKLMLYGKGHHEVAVNMLMTAHSEGLARKTTIPRIEAMASQLSLAFLGGEHEVFSEGEERLEERNEKDSTVLSGQLRGANAIALRWYLKSDAEKVPMTFDVLQKIAYYADSGSLTGHAALSLNVTNAKLHEISIPLPRVMSVTKVEGERVDRWREEKGTLVVSFLPAITSKTSLHIEFERLVDNLPTTLALAPLPVQGATSIAGVIAIGGDKGISLTVEEEKQWERLEVASLREGVFVRTPNLQYAFSSKSTSRPIVLGVKRKISRITSSSGAAYTVERELMTGRWTLRLSVDHAPLSRIRLKKMGALTILGVQGEGMQGWREEGDALLIDLKYGMTGIINGIVDFQFPLDIGREFTLPFLAFPDAVQEEGTLVISRAEGVDLKPVNIDGLRQTSSASGAAQTYAFSHGGWRMTAVVGEIKPRIEIAETSAFSVENDRVVLRNTLTYRVARAPIFSAVMTAPDGFVPKEIVGASIRGWRFDPKTRTITVDFVSAFKGEDSIVCSMERRLGNREERIELSGMSPAPADTFNGTVSIDGAEEFLVRVENLVGIVETDATYVSRQSDWGMAVVVTRKEPSIEASVLSKIAVERGDITVENFIRYNVVHAGAHSFSIALPEGAVNVEVTGEDILASETVHGIVRIALRKPVKGIYTARLVYQQILGAGGRFSISLIRLEGVTARRGYVVVSGEKNGIDAKATAGEGMNGVVRNDFPDEWRPLVDPGAPFLFSYSRDPAMVELDVAEHAAQKIFGARIVSSDLVTFLQEDGTLIHDMTALVVNDAGQTMTVSLGKEASLWGAYIFGTPVKPTVADNGDVIVPIARSVTGAMAFELRLVWIERKAEDAGGMLSLSIPKTDIRIEAGRWKLHVPQGYSIANDQGNMKLVYASPSLTHPSFVAAVADDLGKLLKPWWFALPRSARSLMIALPGIAIVSIVSLIFLRKIVRRRPALLWATGSVAGALLIGIVVWNLGVSELKQGVSAPPEKHPVMEPREQPVFGGGKGGEKINDIEKKRYANRKAQSQLVEYSKKMRVGNEDLKEIQNKLKQEDDRFEQEERLIADGGRLSPSTKPALPKPEAPPKDAESASGDQSPAGEFKEKEYKAFDYMRRARTEGALPLAVTFCEANDHFCQFENDFTGGGSVGFSLSLITHRKSFAIQIAIITVTALVVILLPKYSRLPATSLAFAIALGALAVMAVGGSAAVPYATSVLAVAVLHGLILAIPAMINMLFTKGVRLW